MRNNEQQGIRQHVPNLYHATKNIDLSDRDVAVSNGKRAIPRRTATLDLGLRSSLTCSN
ncbi:MAG: hypothetical protein U5J63_16105 [Fodinibius sp.]|nr:hypothetical protein [Fodinibius sp.]